MSGEIIKLTIDLNQYGIFDIDLSKSYVKTLNPDINIINYKIKKKDNRYYLVLKIQVFSTGLFKFSDLIFFDGFSSYYNFDSISINLNNKINEFFILPYLHKFQRYIAFYILILFFIFTLFSLFLYFSTMKIYNFLNLIIYKYKENKRLIKIKNILSRTEKQFLRKDISKEDYKKLLIEFTKQISKLINSDLSILQNQKFKNLITLKNKSLINYSYNDEDNLFILKENFLNNFVLEFISQIKSHMDNKNG
ncbi:MAG: hypothetical protein ACK4YF_05990 [Exilispira sp.]